jgi:hypothetical protein
MDVVRFFACFCDCVQFFAWGLSAKGNESGRTKKGKEVSVRVVMESIAPHWRKISEFMSHIIERFQRGL